MHPRSPSVSSGFPDEVLGAILLRCVYSGSEFSQVVEEGSDLSQRPAYHKRHSEFAAKVLLVDKRFNRVGTEVLWRSVIVRDPISLATVAAQAATRARFTWRFETMIEGPYHQADVIDVLRLMGALKVFTVRNIASYLYPHLNALPTNELNTITQNCHHIERIQLDAYQARPTLGDICALIESAPTLQALRIEALTSTAAFTTHPNTQATPVASVSALSTLSVGSTLVPEPCEGDTLALDSLLLLMTKSASLFPSLVDLHLNELTPRAVPLLREYGPQLRHLQYALPHRFTCSLDNADLPALCPNLVGVTWLVKDIIAPKPINAFPTSHPTAQRISVWFTGVDRQDDSVASRLLRGSLRAIREGHFPRLGHIAITLEGERIPDFQHAEWFRDYCKTFTTRGVRIEATVKAVFVHGNVHVG